MSVSIKIKGFQSIKNMIEVVVDGYCTIEGESNLGKSAVIRAIHAALSNRMGTEFITENEFGCEVIIESMGHVVKWSKNRKSTVYEVDGKEIHRPGKGTVPDEVRSVGLYAIKTIDKELHWPQMHFQWEQPFIIGSYTDTLAAELIGASQDTIKINRAIKLVNADVSKCKTKVDFLENQHKDLVTSVEKMEEIATKLNEIQKKVDQDEVYRDVAFKNEYTYRTLVEKYRFLWKKWKIFSVVEKNIIPVSLDISYYRNIVNLYQRYRQAYFLVEVSSNNQGNVPDVLSGRQSVVELTRLYKELGKVTEEIKITELVISLPQIQQVDSEKIIRRFKVLISIQEQYMKIQRDIESSVSVMGEIKTKLKEVDSEREKINYILNNLEKCPLCQAPMKNGLYCPDNEVHNGRDTKDEDTQVRIAGNSSQTVS